MFGKDKFANERQSIFMGSIKGLANTVAVATTFLGTPKLYDVTVGWVRSFTIAHYGMGFSDLASLGWFIICGLFVFFVSRASLSTALVMGGLTLATRFL